MVLVATPILAARSRTPQFNAARAILTRSNGVLQPGPAPRFSRTTTSPGGVASPGAHTTEVFRDWQLPTELLETGAVLREEA